MGRTSSRARRRRCWYRRIRADKRCRGLVVGAGGRSSDLEIAGEPVMSLRAWLAIRYSDSAVSAFSSSQMTISSAAGSRWTQDTKDGRSAGPARSKSSAHLSRYAVKWRSLPAQAALMTPEFVRDPRTSLMFLLANPASSAILAVSSGPSGQVSRTRSSRSGRPARTGDGAGRTGSPERPGPARATCRSLRREDG